MTNYYFICTLLPELRVGDSPEINLREYEQLLEENLTERDFAKASTIRNFYEIQNFSEEIERASGFFKAFLILERELRLVMLAFRAKALHRDVTVALQEEDPEDPIIEQILAQKEAQSFEPPEKYEELKIIFEKYKESPLELQKALFEFRIKKIEEMLDLDFFSIDRVLAYLVELILIEKWRQMDKQKGLEIVDSMLKEVS